MTLKRQSPVVLRPRGIRVRWVIHKMRAGVSATPQVAYRQMAVLKTSNLRLAPQVGIRTDTLLVNVAIQILE